MIYIALGSSIGNAEEIFAQTEKQLNTQGITILKKSKILKNPPQGGVAQNTFSNAVWQINIPAQITPHQLLETLKIAEEKLGRNPNAPRWSDRIIDLDIILFQDQIIDTPTLCVPHPRITERDFVLSPLAELVDENYQIPNLGALKTYLKK